MIYALQGKVSAKGDGFFVLRCGSIFFKIFAGKRTISQLPRREVKIFCAVYLRENDEIELYGFLREEELKLFELLTTVNGVGPRMALKIVDLGANHVKAAIAEKKAEFLARIPGVGRKSAERVVVELRGKIKAVGSGALTKQMQMDEEILEVLVGLGFQRKKAKDVLARFGKPPLQFEERLKKALREISR